eukprot:3448136-Pyramimonas_sp.AAC.1
MPSRNFGADSLELDTFSRVYSNAPNVQQDTPALVALDHGAVFPSLSQEFMCMVFSAVQVPRAFMSVIDQLCTELEAFSMVNNTPTHAWWVTSGIFQGCSISGSMHGATTA